MKFRVFIQSVFNYDRDQFLYLLPEVTVSGMVPLFETLTGNCKIAHSMFGKGSNTGINIHRTGYYINTYLNVVNDISMYMLYIDKKDHYRTMYKAAQEAGERHIEIKNRDIVKYRFKQKTNSYNFQEQLYLQNILPNIIPDLITNQIEVEKQLELLNLELI